jgi:hypothetical protein
MMEAVSTSETSVNFYETTLRIVPEGCHHDDMFLNVNISALSFIKTGQVRRTHLADIVHPKPDKKSTLKPQQ